MGIRKHNTDPDLFEPGRLAKVDEANEAMARSFRDRLVKNAGFANVPEPLAMRTSVGATVYYLFFASHADVANSIVNRIFRRHRRNGPGPL